MTLFKNKCDISTYLAALRPEVGGGTDLARIIISSSVESYPLELSIKRKKTMGEILIEIKLHLVSVKLTSLFETFLYKDSVLPT